MISRGVHHVSVNVEDLDAGRRFYVDSLGLAEIERPDLDVGGVWLQAGPQQIHLIERPPPPALGQHFSLLVDDLDTALATLGDRGIEIDHLGGIAGVCRQAFLSDPAGNLIELTEPV